MNTPTAWLSDCWVDRKAPSQVSQTLLDMPLKLPLSGPFSPQSEGTDMENVKCSFWAELYEWHAFIIWSLLSLLSC